MKKKYINIKVLAVLLGFANVSALAGDAPPPGLVPLSYDDNELYIGAVWTFGQGAMPAIELGYRQVEVDASGDVEGGALSLSYQIGKGLDKLRLKGVKGQDNLQGELGFGFSFLHNAPLGTLGVQGNHFNAGGDYLFGQGPELFGGINTIGRYDRSRRCPSGYSYTAATGLCNVDAD